MKNSKLGLAGLFAAAALSLGAASSAAEPLSGEKRAGAQIKIGYINLSDQIPFVVLVRKSIQRAAKANGVDLVVCDSNLDAQKAIQCAAQFKTQRVQGILNFQLDASAAPRVCAAGPDVPVVSIDIHQKPCETTFYGADNLQAGRLAGQALGQFAKKRWNCRIDGLLSLNSRAAGQVVIDRENGSIAGVRSVCRGAKVIKVETKATTDTTIQPFRDTLTRLPGKKRLLVVATNDDQYIGAQGSDPTSWPYMCGRSPFKNWVADTAYFPERYGDTVVPLLLSLIDGQKKPKQVFINHRVVTPSNLKQIQTTACR